jgi:DNA-binding GntR family transcriptional regulator
MSPRPRRKPQARSLEREVYEILRDEILLGDLKPGAPLAEAQLSSQLGVSKTPVREALIRLQRDGLVDITPYRGARVGRLSEKDVRDVCQVRLWIETQIARDLALTPPSPVLEQLTANVASSENALQINERDSYLQSIRGFSEILIQASGNLVAQEILSRLRDTLSLIANAARTADETRRRRSIEEHASILDALRAADPAAAEVATRVHLDSIQHDCLLALSALTDTDFRAPRAELDGAHSAN